MDLSFSDVVKSVDCLLLHLFFCSDEAKLMLINQGTLFTAPRSLFTFISNSLSFKNLL